MNGKKSLVAVALILVVLAVPLLVQPVFADELPDCYVRVVKEVKPPSSDQAFEFGTWFKPIQRERISFELGHGDEWVFSFGVAGELLVEEVVPEGWQVPGVECTWNPEYSVVTYGTAQVTVEMLQGCDQVTCVFTNEEIPPEPPAAPPPFVPEASTFILLGSAATTLAGYVGLQIRARRRR